MGHKVEIANLGRVGSSPKDYADVAEKAIPLLKPDLVLVSVLQGDDLSQGRAEAMGLNKESGGVRLVISRIVRVLYPNLMALVRPLLTTPESSVEWKRQTTEMLRKTDDAGRAKVDSLDATVRSLYLEGNLNPGLLDLAIRVPDYWSATMDLGSPYTGSLISVMGKHLSRIKQAAEPYGTRVMVVAVPYRSYVNRSDLDQVKRLGFIVREDMLTGTAPDDAIRLACGKAGLPFYSVTDGFRREVKGRHLFFDFDGHFNREGNVLFFELLLPLIVANALAGH
jgi:hypothetical protein